MAADGPPYVGAKIAAKSEGVYWRPGNRTRFEAPLRSRGGAVDGINSAIFSGEIGQGRNLDRNYHIRPGSRRCWGELIWLTYRRVLNGDHRRRRIENGERQ